MGHSLSLQVRSLGILTAWSLGLISNAAFAAGAPPSRQFLVPFFEEAAASYSVPLSLLESIGFVESRWQQAQAHSHSASHQVNSDWGVMGLDGTDGTSGTLATAAGLLGVPKERLMHEARLNILGAAAVLHKLALQHLGVNEHDIHDSSNPASARFQAFKNDPLAWSDIVLAYTGLSQPSHPDVLEPSELYLYDVYNLVMHGREPSADDASDDVSIPMDARVSSLPAEWTRHIDVAAVNLVTHPTLAGLNIIQSRADAGNCSYVGSRSFRFIVIHDTEGTFPGALQVLKHGEPGKLRSANYLIRSHDGLIAELVDPDRGYAWHASNWNPISIGIEHEAKDMLQTGWYTRSMYESSGKLVRFLATKYGIPFDKEHIFGHNFWRMEEYRTSPLRAYLLSQGKPQKQTHVDPGPLWRWDLYFDFLRGDNHAFENLSSTPTQVFTRDSHPITRGNW